jgi:hypothetical protein
MLPNPQKEGDRRQKQHRFERISLLVGKGLKNTDVKKGVRKNVRI